MMIVLVDENDLPVGVLPKMETHEKGLLYRAFSVFIFNRKGQLLIQQRAIDKYHCGGLWTNTCCSHPAPGEEPLEGARRRLEEEMGITADLQYVFRFLYMAPLDKGLTEHELDHVFVGYTNQLPTPDPDEVAAWKYISPGKLRKDIELHPDKYTPWFRIIMERYFPEIKAGLEQSCSQ
ncbi:MAG: isopentenyl-diphosphate Delta-isomerase [Tannerellaceae bacterium]|nr:isopentenyl-diphosphate Delta-isomerase [Tannerellaceae bacterium]